MVANVKYYSLPLQICVVCLTSAKNNDQCFFEVIHLESRWIHHLLSKGYSQNLAHNCHDHVNWKTKQNSTVFYNIPMIFDVKNIEIGITFLDFDLLSNKSMQLSTHSNTSNTQQIFLLLYIKAPFICIYDMTWFAFTDFKIFMFCRVRGPGCWRRAPHQTQTSSTTRQARATQEKARRALGT